MDKEGYRIERMGPPPDELRDVPGIELLDAEWVMVRNHDDELMSVYGTREDAEAALRDANALILPRVDKTDWHRCGFLRHCGEREDCEMRSGEECCHDATCCKYWHER